MKKVFIFLLAILITATSIFTVGCNEDPPENPNTAEDCPSGTHKYTLENRCSECGALWNYTDGLELVEIGDGYSVKNRGKSKETEIVIPYGYNGKPVNRIDNAAFSDTDITSITIPGSVVYIGHHAFDHSQLSKIILPDTLTYIDNAVFTNTPYYDNPQNWENGNALYIGKYLIAVKNTVPSSYKVKDGTLSIASSAFQGQTAVSEVILPSNLVSIGGFAFFGCTSLTSIKYKGSEEQWGKILKWSSWDEVGGEYTVTYNYTGE